LSRQSLHYGSAVVVVAAVLLVAVAAEPIVGPGIGLLLAAAVGVVALWSGRGPAALASVLSAGVLAYVLFLSDYPWARGDSSDVARFALFLVLAGTIPWLTGDAQEQRGRYSERGRESSLRWLRPRRRAGEAERGRAEATETLTRWHETERELRRRETELADFFETASIAMHWVGPDGTIMRANQAELDLLGYSRDEYVGRNIAEFHADQPALDHLMRRRFLGERIHRHAARLRCRDGSIRDVEIDASGFFEEGRLVHTRCFTRDVSREKLAHEAMARLAAIVTWSSDAIVGKTLDGIVTSWNAAAERIFGYTAEEMVGESIFRLIPPELHDTERDLLQRLHRGEVVEFSEVERIRKDGQRIWISLSVSPIRDAAGNITGAASMKRDITERKLLQERLLETQRLQAVGQLAGGIAHEANNQMSVVLGGAHFLLQRADLPEAARQDIEHIRRAAERTAGITQQLLAFSRRQILQVHQLDLSAVVRSIAPVLQRSLSESHELVTRLAELRPIWADQRQLEQVLLNLTLNARDAMREGGRLTIATEDVQVAAPDEGRGTRLPPGHYVLLEVRDTGQGIDAATLERIFEPFFTTKEVGQGTGLGLSVVHGIVGQLGGHIRVETGPRLGTAFRLYFPVVAPALLPEAPRDTYRTSQGEGKVAVLAEDDPNVRGMMVRALAEAGWEVLEAENGRAALELVRGRAGRVDLVVADVGMPELDGEALARRLAEEQPELPVILMSGYGDRSATDPHSSRRTRPFLQKPVSPKVLLDACAEVLADRP
jgi:PAS domain S-box-containing protein